MKVMQRKEILVYAHWVGMACTCFIGLLYATPSRGKELFSFEYENGWLQSDNAQIIDPDLQLFEGAQYLRDEKDNFGVFLDSSPDRWGRVLFFFSSRRRHTRSLRDWSSDVCSSD